MSKEMNKLQLKITRYDITIGLFMSLIIGLTFSWNTAVVQLLGITIGMLNYLLTVYSTQRWLLIKKPLFLVATFGKVLITVIIIIPFANNSKLIIGYLVGFILHYVVMVYCTLTTKGSA